MKTKIAPIKRPIEAKKYPKNTMGWIMGRTSKITDEEYKKIITSLEKLGYKKEQFEFVKHD